MDTSPLSERQHLAYVTPYILASFAFAYFLALAQRALFEIAGRDAAWSFSNRWTDYSVYSFLPALPLAAVVCFPIYFRAFRWYWGDRIFDLLDWPDRSVVPMSLRQEIRTFPALAWAVAILLTFLNLAAFDTLLQVGHHDFRYSTFFSFTTHQHSLDEIQELVIYSQRIAPNGNITDHSFLEIRLKDGRTVDTFYLIRHEQIPQVVAAIQRNASSAVAVTRSNGYK